MAKSGRSVESSLVGDGLNQEMASLAILDLNEPDVGIVVGLAGGVGIELELGDIGVRLQPQAVTIQADRLGVEASRTLDGVVGLEQNGTGASVALADHDGRGTGQFGAADQGGHPQIAG